MWNPSEFDDHASSSSYINPDYSSFNSFTEEEGIGSESPSNLPQISNDYDKLFLGDWLPSASYSSSHVKPALDFSSCSNSLPLSSYSYSVPPSDSSYSGTGISDFKPDVIGEGDGRRTTGEVQLGSSQAVSVTDLGKMIESGEEKNRGENSSREPKKLKPSGGKKPQQEGSSSGTKKPAKAAKKNQRLGPKITALQRLISPYGKTDAASVLNETANNIKYLHDQIKILSAPYISTQRRQAAADMNGDLRSKGLCLVPVTPELVNLTSQLSSNRTLPGNAAPYSRFRI